MDAGNILVEKCSLNLKRTFSHVFDWDKMDVSYVKVDLIDKFIFAMPSNYEWHLTYFDNDLDLQISERIVPGIQYWNDYSSKYSKVLLRNKKRETKVDICTQYKNTFEILSINSKAKLSHADMMTIFKWKPIIAYYSNRVWSESLDNILPLREEIIIHKDSIEEEYDATDESVDICPYIRFGNIQFTRKEIVTIRLLLSYVKVDEISAIQRCSSTAEHTRIKLIKKKLNCKNNSPEELLNKLNEHGVTLPCLDRITVYP